MARESLAGREQAREPLRRLSVQDWMTDIPIAVSVVDAVKALERLLDEPAAES